LQNFYSIFETARGHCGVAWNSRGISRFQLPAADAGSTERYLLRRVDGSRPGNPPASLSGVIEAVTGYFDGAPLDFAFVTLDLSEQEPLFRRIYAAVRAVGWGRTTTYGALAASLALGPEFARHVGQAMANNPIPLIIPCHRVLAAGGKPGGFSAPGGVDAKVYMLALEGVCVATHSSSPSTAQQSLF
jgi:methylated-DNA-[protein]-cysteine S-methyltransferase